jgi:hypothetical protein
MLEPPQDYELTLADGWYSLTAASAACKFSGAATKRGVAKLYTISSDRSLLYVGIAQRPMAGRLRHGFLANGLGGYHGYKWKFLETCLRLSVWTCKLDGRYAPLQVMETIEAEVAFLCRQISGQWPTHQHEIHFSPSEEWHRDAALRIYQHATAC